jgi:hypothetical protein
MKTKNKNNPSADFFDFEIYPLSDLKDISKEVDGNKSVVVLLKDANQEEIDLLGKIFKAVGKNLETDGCLLNSSSSPSYKEVTDVIDFKKLLVFGIAPKDIGLHLNVKIYELIPFQHRELLFSHSLKVIMSDLNKKKMLWGQLQLMFKE